MGRKRRPSAHERQIRFFTFFFGTLFILIMIALLYLMNRTPGSVP
jgi:hypothetical protein